MNYSAVATDVVNLPVRVHSHVPVSSLNQHKYENCISAHRSPDCSVIRGNGQTQTSRERRAAPRVPNITHGKWFSFLQGLEPSAAVPPQILVAAREATQPV